MSTNELTAKVRKLKRLQTKAEELKEEITAIQDELKALLTAQNVEEMKAGIKRNKRTINKQYNTNRIIY